LVSASYIVVSLLNFFNKICQLGVLDLLPHRILDSGPGPPFFTLVSAIMAEVNNMKLANKPPRISLVCVQGNPEEALVQSLAAFYD
jgi:hypothetical protein